MKIRVIYIISNIDKSLAFEWLVQHINHDKFKISFILLNPEDSYLEQFLIQQNIDVCRIKFSGKRSYLNTLINLIRKLRIEKPQVIHTHLFDASLLGIISGYILRIKARIYTRHYSTFHHKYYPKAVKLDKLINFLCTDIVAISKNVQNTLHTYENVNLQKIHLIHHGFDLDIFKNTADSSIEKLKHKYKTVGKYPVVGIIARYTDLKGHKYIIPALKKIALKYPNAYFIFANASGGDKQSIKKQLISELQEESYVEIVFEEDLSSLYKLFDIYIHTPIDSEIEAFGQTYVEALAGGIPSVFTLSGVANEFIKHNTNALVVDYCNSEQIAESIFKIIDSQNLRKNLILQGYNSIRQFNIANHILKLEKLYYKKVNV